MLELDGCAWLIIMECSIDGQSKSLHHLWLFVKISKLKEWKPVVQQFLTFVAYIYNLYHTFLIFNIHLKSRYIWRTQYIFPPTFIMCSFALRLGHQFLQTHCLHWHKRFNVYTLFTLASKVQYACILTT